jgi:hypothetical protein
MNWDISTGRFKQSYGRILQMVGRHLARRSLVLDGEALEYAGRLQMRYGVLKHQVQWNHVPLRHGRDGIATSNPYRQAENSAQ